MPRSPAISFKPFQNSFSRLTLVLWRAITIERLRTEDLTTSASLIHARTRTSIATCPLLPPGYPRGWELMVRYQCVIYGYGPSYYPSAYYRYPTAYPLQREQVHRRPYLRPGWWW